MIFREAGSADAESIAELHARSWQRAYRGILRDDFLAGDVVGERRRVWTRRFEQPPDNQHVLLALNDADLAGFACVYGNADVEWGSLLDNLHVRVDSMSRGIGTQLIARAARWSSENYPGRKFFLWVFEQNHAARRFYELLGATHSESIRTAVPGGGTAMECRYTWSDVTALIKAAVR